MSSAAVETGGGGGAGRAAGGAGLAGDGVVVGDGLCSAARFIFSFNA